MKKIFTIFITILMIISSLGIFACSGGGTAVDNNVVLIDVAGRSSYDLKDAMCAKCRNVVEGEEIANYNLTSVATQTKFVFTDSVIDLSEIYKEYYLVEAVNKDGEVVYIGHFDFHDVTNDGIIWCEMSEYTVGAVRTDAPSEIGFEEVSEEFCEGQVIVAQPTDPRYWRFAYYAIMPFHSKEYYLKFTDYKTTFEIRYCRKAVYDRNSWNFDPDTMEHLDGVYAEPRSTINVKYFGCGGNVSSTGAQLNVQQTLTFRMVDILEKFEAIGKHGQGHGNYWYFVGTSHSDSPYKITYFLQFIDVY